jgi:predicted MPP superfamily phosphohydrolase
VFNIILKVVRKGPVRKNTSALLAIICALSMTTYGYYKINQPPVIKNVSIPIKDLGSSLDGFTITLLSDIHLGPTVGKKQLETAVHMSNNLESGMINDYISIQYFNGNSTVYWHDPINIKSTSQDKRHLVIT